MPRGPEVERGTDPQKDSWEHRKQTKLFRDFTTLSREGPVYHQLGGDKQQLCENMFVVFTAKMQSSVPGICGDLLYVLNNLIQNSFFVSKDHCYHLGHISFLITDH